MVRNYVRKTTDNPNYSQADLQKAIEEVKAGRATVYGAHMQYKIPYVTLYSRVKGLRAKVKNHKGRPTYIDHNEEVKLAESLKIMEKWGFGMSRKEVLEAVGTYIAANEKQTNFKEGVPGEDWFLSFKKRHNLSLKIPQNIEYARKKATDPFLIYAYFNLLEKVLTENNLIDKPERIWNLDETSLSIDPRKSKVVGEVNKPSSRTVSSPGRENTTVLAMCNAAGGKAPPLIIFKGAYVWDQWFAPKGTEFAGTVYAASKKGWMESNIFKNYFLKTIIPTIGNERPVVIVYDGHSTHVSVEIIEAAIQNNVIIIKLPAHTSHLLQPLDLAVFKSFKSKWDQKVISWQRQNFGRKIPKKIFSQFLCETWQSISPEVIRNGFRKSGIYPINKNVIPKETFPPDAMKRWEAECSKNHPDRQCGESEENRGGPSTSHSVSPQTQETSKEANLSFEEILLTQIRQKPQPEKEKRSKVCPGAEILTTEEALARIKEKNDITIDKEKKKKIVKKVKQTQKHLLSSSSSEEDIDQVPYMESDDEDFCDEQQEDDIPVAPPFIAKGKWVIVQYCTKKQLKHFVGQVQEKCGDDWVIKFLKYENKKFIWPKFEDLDTVSDQDVVKILPDPKDIRRGIHKFDFYFNEYKLT